MPSASSSGEQPSISQPTLGIITGSPRMNRSVSCVEIHPSFKEVENTSSSSTRPKSEHVFLASVFSRSGSSRNRKQKDLKLNVGLANGHTNPLRASKSNLDISRLSTDTLSPDLPSFKTNFYSKRTTRSSTTTPTPGSETGSMFIAEEQLDDKTKKKFQKASKKKSKEASSSATDIKKVCSSDGVAPAILISGSLTSSFLSPKSAGEELLNGRRGLEPSDLSDSSDSDEDFQVAGDGILAKDLDLIDIPPCPVNHAEGKETINAIISCNIDQLFTMLFTNSKFYLDFHTSRKTFNIHQSPWEYGKDGKQTRQVAMTVSLSAVMGPKHSQVTETQIMDIISKPGLFYIIDSESANAGVPYADTFYVTVHYCLSRVSASESKLIIVNQIKYRKSVWGITKSIIEKNAWAGIEEFYCHLEKSLKEECTKMMIGSSPLPSPKHSGSTIPRRRLPRKKGQAPGIPIAITPSARISLRAGSVGADMGTIPAAENVPDLVATDGSLVLKIVLIVLSGLLCLNGFLYFKLNHLETGSPSSLFPAPSFTFTGEIPQNHQDWLVLLQKQQALHQIELQKWHQVLMSALKILHQAESDLEALKFHIGSYAGAKYSVQMATHPSSSEDLQHKSTESKAVDDNDQKSLDKDTSDQ